MTPVTPSDRVDRQFPIYPTVAGARAPTDGFRPIGPSNM